MTDKVKLALYRPGQALKSSRGLRIPEFLDNWHMKVVRLSALSTSPFYPQECGWKD
jgi:hypothetical protein